MKKLEIFLAVLVLLPMSSARAGQNQPAAKGRQQGQAGAPAPAPPRVTISLSAAELQQVQVALEKAGFAPGASDGRWSDRTAHALIAFQQKQGMDASGHVDLMTIVALGLPQLLLGEMPPAASATPVPPQAGKDSTAELYAGPAAVSRVQQALDAEAVKAGSEAAPGNILGVWHAATGKSAAVFQKAHGLAPTGALDLELVHALGLDAVLAQPKPANVPMLTDAQAPFAGAPLELGPAAVRLVQQALARSGGRVAVDGRWKAEDVRALTAFQQERHLEPTGMLTLRTIRALGFAHPLVDLARAAGPPS